MSAPRIERYQVVGQAIDSSCALEVCSLPAEHWGPIAQVYPEVKAAGLRAGFMGKRNTTIFPPVLTSGRHLLRLATYGDADRTIYRRVVGGRLVGVLIHVHGKGDGYDSVHIYRMRPPRPRRLWRR